MADIAAHVNLGRRLGEGEVGRTHADLGVRAEHLASEEQDGLLQVGEGDVLVDVEALHLMEYAVRTGADGLVAEYSSGADDSDRQLGMLHRTHLH